MGNANTEWKWRAAREVTFVACAAGACLFAGAPTKAQVAAATQESAPNSRLLSAEEGRAIVDAARDQDQKTRGARDCSHLVHQTNLEAGFEYAYASSFELYAGDDNFERVRHPQPGDLIVWPGHVGIVLEPLAHSFYSLVSTGLEAQNYEGPYWKSRGRPRFYRYKVESAEVLTAVKGPAPVRTPNLEFSRAPGPSPQSRLPRFQLCTGRSVVYRATSNTAPRSSAPPAPYSPGCKNCAPAVPGRCRRGPATQSNPPVAGVVPAQNCRRPRRVQTNSHRRTQNLLRDRFDEQGANSPAPRVSFDPDLARHPRWPGLPPRSTIEN